MNNSKTNMNRSQANQGMRIVLWIALGLLVLTLGVGLPVVYMAN